MSLIHRATQLRIFFEQAKHEVMPQSEFSLFQNECLEMLHDYENGHSDTQALWWGYPPTTHGYYRLPK
jgi:hypothetical protein